MDEARRLARSRERSSAPRQSSDNSARSIEDEREEEEGIEEDDEADYIQPSSSEWGTRLAHNASDLYDNSDASEEDEFASSDFPLGSHEDSAEVNREESDSEQEEEVEEDESSPDAVSVGHLKHNLQVLTLIGLCKALSFRSREYSSGRGSGFQTTVRSLCLPFCCVALSRPGEEKTYAGTDIRQLTCTASRRCRFAKTSLLAVSSTYAFAAIAEQGQGKRQDAWRTAFRLVIACRER